MIIIEKKTSESKKRANKKYQQLYQKQYKIMVNKRTESEVIDQLDKQENKQGYIKDLIKKDMANKK